MTKSVRALWLDDDFSSSAAEVVRRLDNMRSALSSRLKSSHDIDLIVTREPLGSNAFVKLDDDRFDLLLLDLALSEQDSEKDGVGLLLRMHRHLWPIPTVIVSNQIGAPQMEARLQRAKGMYFGAFPKSMDAIENIAAEIANAVRLPPVSIVVLSDLHAGHLEQDAIFKDRLLKEFRDCRKRFQPDLLVATGDFAWKSQATELTAAASFINQARHALGVTGPNRFHFCPGNHDVVLEGSGSWAEYRKFVGLLNDPDPGLEERFQSFRHGLLDDFREQGHMLAVAKVEDKCIVVSALNSVSVRNSGARVETSGAVGEEQWRYLEKRHETLQFPRGYLKLAILHHPLFAAPSLTTAGGKGDAPIDDQAHALFRLASLGYQCVIHGHTHYACVYRYNFNLLGPVAVDPAHNAAGTLMVVAAPTLGASPNPVVPYRQYLILQFGHFDSASGTRTFTARSRIYQPGVREWEDGATFEGSVVC